MQKILLVEDDIKIAELLQAHLIKYGYDAVVCTEFGQVVKNFEREQPAMVLMDINLPSFDGFYWTRQLRQLTTCPIIFISARAGEMDQIMALEHGGDDYITKPFHYEVVLAKIRSHLRRAYGEYAPKLEERIVEAEGLMLYPERLLLMYRDKQAQITKNECAVLEILLKRYPRIASREALLEKLWDDQAYVDENTLNVNMNRVRKKLRELSITEAVETVRGAGYQLHNTWKRGE
jgi:two-component system, OmpR family, response regulator YxdJ